MEKRFAGFLAVCLGLSMTGLSAAPGVSTPLGAYALSDMPRAGSDVASFALLQTPTPDTAAGTPDARVRGTVAQLGVGKKVRLRTVTGEELRGRITSIGDGTFGLDTGQQRVISYADVSALERQGMSGWLKGGIIGGAVITGLAIAAGALER